MNPLPHDIPRREDVLGLHLIERLAGCERIRRRLRRAAQHLGECAEAGFVGERAVAGDHFRVVRQRREDLVDGGDHPFHAAAVVGVDERDTCR